MSYKKNLIVRGGADFSKIKQELQKTQQQLNKFSGSINKSMSAVGKAFKIGLGYISVRAIAAFVKETTKWGSDVAEVQNVVNVTFGAMTKDIEEFSKSAMDNFGLGELAAKKYSSTMGAMLKSSGLTGETMKDMSIDLAKLTADMASFHNLDNDAVFKKIMSGMAGMSRPLKDLGINMNIANLQSFAMSQGIKKSYQNMTQAEQAMLRYNYLLSVTGDMQGDFSRNAHNWAHQLKILGEQWNTLKATLGQAFINVLTPIIRGFNTLIKYIQVAAEYFKAFTALIFGETQASRAVATDLGYTADALGDVEDGLGGVGKAGKKAGKDLKGSLAPFDEINILANKASDSAGGLADELGGIGGVGPVDLGQADTGEMDIDTSRFEEKLNRIQDWFKEFYSDWGFKDFFAGIKEGLDLINFDAIRENFSRAFENLGEIAQAALVAMQPVWQAAGEAIGTFFKYGIAIAGNLFEPVVEGFANFTENMKETIIEWMFETSETLVNYYNNLRDIFEIIGQSWLNSIEKYKELIAELVERTFTAIVETIMLATTIIVDTFGIIAKSIKDFFEENKEDVQRFTDSILEIFTDIWDLIVTVWEDALNSIKKFWDDWGKDIVKGAMGVVTDIGKWFLYLWNDLVKPVWDTMMKWLKKIWSDSLKGIVDELLGFVGRVGDLILKLWNGIIQPLLDKILKILVPVFTNAFQTLLDVAGTVINGIAGVIKNLLKILNGIIDFLVGVFTGDWKRAWEGISNIFKGIVDGLVAIFKVPLNLIISGINTFIRGLNKISIPDWVPGVGGKGFSIKEIPHLAKGAVIPPNREFLAVLGDQKSGTNIETPEKLLRQIVREELGNISSQQSDNNYSGDGDIVLKIGETEFGRIAIKSINTEQRRVGKTLIIT